MSIYDRSAKLKTPPVRTEFMPFRGGLNTETTRWSVPPGQLKSSRNYEHGIDDGYQDILGYERFDGQPSPSAAQYSILDVTITGSFSVGDTVTQLVSGATGVVVVVVTTETPNYLALTKITGTFDATNDLQVSAVTEGASLSLAIPSGAATSKLNGQYNNLAADEYRNDITAVPGSGDVTGVIKLNDIKYAFRNNAGGTATAIHKSSSSGWTAVALNYVVSFTTGNWASGEPAEGETITVGANSATVLRVVTEGGDWTAGTATGRIITSAGAPASLAAAAATFSGGGTATISVAEAAITLSPDGRYEFDINQFGGQAGAQRIYGCDGVNQGFEFDGSVYVPIVTGMTADTPNHVIVHKNHLFFAFDGSAQHSGINTPYIWSPVFGSGELATGDTITGFMSEPGAQIGGALGIYNRNTTHMLYGSSSSDWQLVRYRDEVGAAAHSIQQIGQTVFQDDRGITTLHTAQEYGNFQHSTLSRNIQAAFDEKKTLVTASCVARDKNQYRVFYTDKTAFFITMDGRKIKGIMPIKMNHVVTSIFSLEDSSGNEEIMFGSDDGFVYQMEKGTSFDGDTIEAFMFFHFTFNKYLRWLKKYLSVSIETEGDGYAEYNVSYELGYGATELVQPGTDTNIAAYSDTRWDLFTWDAFIWDGQKLSPITNRLRGSAENIALIITKNSDYFTPLRMSGAFFRHTLRRLMRD